MATNPASNLSSLFIELNKLGQNGDYFKALKIANKILQEAPHDEKALHCKIVCLIQESKFQDALTTISKIKNNELNLNFEKAYCLYRLNKITQALAALSEIKNLSNRESELKAQILYRVEEYDECFQLYKNIIKNAEDDYEEERETNLAAVTACMVREDKDQVKNVPKIREHTYELCYNAACVILNQGKIIEAVGKLKQAEDLCVKSLEEDDFAEDEIEAEVAVIRTQLAYALQLLKKNNEALNIYNQVLKKKPSDIALVAVASNNIISINKDQNVFDSKKKIRQATADGLQFKLTGEQLYNISVNHALLSLYTNQYDLCKKQTKALQEKYPKTIEHVLILSAVLSREKQAKKAIVLLKEHIKQHPELSFEINLVITHLLISQGQVKDACEILNSMGDASFRLGVVSLLVSLYKREDQKDFAAKLLNNAVQWHKKKKTNSDLLVELLRASSQFHLQNGDPQTAAGCLEDLRKINKDDLRVLAKLISAYSQFDQNKSQEISKQLPRIEVEASSIDVDSLEASHWSLGAKYVKKATRAEQSPASGGKNDMLIQKSQKKKKRKKGKLPKNYDSSVDPDPERWLPRKERSNYRKKKDKRGQGVGKGTQGAAAGGSAVDYLDASKNPQSFATASPSAASPPGSGGPQGPRQQRPQATQKKRRKKGNKW